MAKADIAPLMTKVVDALKTLVASSDGTNWIKPWVETGLGRQYRSTGELYRGTNQLWLGLIAVAEQLELPHIWAGYNTWQTMGYQVRKGEKAKYNPLYATPITTCKEHGRAKDGDRCCDGQYTFMMLKVLKGVFHLTQVEPVEGETQSLPALPELPERSEFEPHGIISAWRDAGMRFMVVDSDRAYYSPTDDYINMPPIEAFNDEVGYHSTIMHEAVHWTGHSSRLDRPKMNVFGTPAYAFEELIAEIGSAMLSVATGISPEPNPNAGEYLANWLQVLSDDPTRLQDAASEAEKAAGFLMDLAEGEQAAA